MSKPEDPSPPGDRAPARAPRDELESDPHAQILAARGGDPEAMKAIYEAEAPRLLRRLRNLTGNLSEAYDLTHDVFVVAFSGRAGFDGDAALSTWLYGIGLNKWRNEQRKSARRRQLLAAAPPRDAGQRTPLDEYETMFLSGLQRRFEAAIVRLSAPLREAFVLRVIEQLPLREAAALAGVSQASMSKRARKAEARVRAALERSDTRTRRFALEPTPNHLADEAEETT